MYALNYIFPFIVPFIFIASFCYAFAKKVRVYDSFTEGAKGAIPLIVSIFPYISAVAMLSQALEISGAQARIEGLLSPVYAFFGVPKDLAPLILIKPLSGSGAIVALTEILECHGVDTYIGRCACVIYASSDTIFYVGAVYFAGLKRKKLTAALIISLTAFLLSVIFGCFLCKFM